MTESEESERHRRVGSGLVDNLELREALTETWPDFERIRQMVVDIYQRESGRHTAEPREIASWLGLSERTYPDYHGLRVDRTIPRWVMYPDITDKARVLMQRRCHICNIYRESDFILFFLRMPPRSHQSTDTKLRNAFTQAISDDLTRKGFDFSDFYDSRLCVAVTFVMANGRRKNDSDNLAKNLLDALQGFAYADDEQIEHLDLLRLQSRSDETFIIIRIAGTNINGLDDVINPEFPIAWLGGPGPIDLSTYLHAMTDDQDRRPG